MLPSTEIESNTENPIEIESNIIVANSSTRSSSTMSMENLSIVLNAASEEKSSHLYYEMSKTQPLIFRYT